MTEKDKEIQELHRANQKLKTELDAAIADLREFSYCCTCESYNKDGKYTGICNRDGQIYVWNHSCVLWEWRGAND